MWTIFSWNIVKFAPPPLPAPPTPCAGDLAPPVVASYDRFLREFSVVLVIDFRYVLIAQPIPFCPALTSKFLPLPSDQDLGFPGCGFLQGFVKGLKCSVEIALNIRSYCSANPELPRCNL